MLTERKDALDPPTKMKVLVTIDDVTVPVATFTGSALPPLLGYPWGGAKGKLMVHASYCFATYQASKMPSVVAVGTENCTTAPLCTPRLYAVSAFTVAAEPLAKFA